MASDYSKLKRVGRLAYNAWQERPDSPKWMSTPVLIPYKVFIESAEEFIDIQFETGLAITQGVVAGKNQYGQVERDRVESLGTKFIYSPGGFQI